VTGLAEHVVGWAPGPVELQDAVGEWAVGAFAALLDVAAPVAAGEPVPPLWHWLAFLDHPAHAELGADGHPAAGHFLPPIPHRRRMFAGGRLRIDAPLRVDEPAVRRTSVAAVTPRTGRSGEMLFVTLRHEFRVAGELRVVEEQDVVYRSSPAGRARSGPPDPAPDGPVRAGPGEIALLPDEPLLFGFSALTYNAHRIHYDAAYATGVEGYPGLVVHGPLLALLLLELPRRFAPGNPVRGFTFRLERPAFAGVPVLAGPDRDAGLDGAYAAGVPGCPPSVRGRVDPG
jgi:3-methylfumaryl-CoA hydratase